MVGVRMNGQRFTFCANLCHGMRYLKRSGLMKTTVPALGAHRPVFCKAECASFGADHGPADDFSIVQISDLLPKYQIRNGRVPFTNFSDSDAMCRSFNAVATAGSDCDKPEVDGCSTVQISHFVKYQVRNGHVRFCALAMSAFSRSKSSRRIINLASDSCPAPLPVYGSALSAWIVTDVMLTKPCSGI